MKDLSVAQIQVCELGLAEPRGVRQHGLEHPLQLSRRTRNDAEHLGRRGLLLQRLGKLLLCLVSAALCFSKLAGAGFELLPQPRGRGAPLSHARSGPRSGGTRLTTTTRSALRALARQGHPRAARRSTRAVPATDIRNITRLGRWVRPFTAVAQTETGPVNAVRVGYRNCCP